MRISLVTFGCRLNQAESLDLEARLAAAGHTVLPLRGGAGRADADCAGPDVVIVRGCSVTARAQRDCEKEIARLRARFPAARIVRAGCMPGAAERDGLSAIGGMEYEGASASVYPGAPVPMSKSRAYLKVQDGCSGRCAFCIVPHFRGRPVSVPFAEVVGRAEAFLAAGYREIIVTGCNLALYRDGGKSLPDVLCAVASAGGGCSGGDGHRVRIGSLEPGLCGNEILDVMERCPNICRFLHLSLQSGSGDVLRRMRRPYGITEAADLAADARRRFGERLCLGADVIAGFPGEREEDFAETRAFLERFGFCNVHAFPYSERPGTPAAAFAGAVPRAVRKARANVLSCDARGRMARFAEGFAGGEVEVCVERGGDRGRSGEYLPVRLATARPRRSLVRVRVSTVSNGVLHE